MPQSLSRQLTLFQGCLLVLGISSAVYFLAFLCYVASNYILVEGYQAKDGNPVGRDFTLSWTAANLAHEEGVGSLYSPGRFGEKLKEHFGPENKESIFYAYPPHYLLLLWPFGALGYGTALVAWLIVSIVIFLLAGVFFLQKGWTWAGALLLAPNITFSLLMGQNGLLMSAFLLLGLRFVTAEPAKAGISFGFLVLKPQLALMVPIYLFAQKRWKILVWGAGTAVLVIAVSVAIFGIDVWQQYLHSASEHTQKLLGTSFYLGMPTIYNLVFGMSHSVGFSTFVQFVCTFMVAIVSFQIFRRIKDEALQAAVFATGTYLLTPYAFIYDLPLLSVAVIYFVLQRRERLTRWQALLAGLIWFLAPLQLVAPVGGIIILLFYVELLQIAKAA